MGETSQFSDYFHEWKWPQDVGGKNKDAMELKGCEHQAESGQYGRKGEESLQAHDGQDVRGMCSRSCGRDQSVKIQEGKDLIVWARFNGAGGRHSWWPARVSFHTYLLVSVCPPSDAVDVPDLPPKWSDFSSEGLLLLTS